MFVCERDSQSVLCVNMLTYSSLGMYLKLNLLMLCILLSGEFYQQNTTKMLMGEKKGEKEAETERLTHIMLIEQVRKVNPNP